MFSGRNTCNGWRWVVSIHKQQFKYDHVSRFERSTKLLSICALTPSELPLVWQRDHSWDFIINETSTNCAEMAEIDIYLKIKQYFDVGVRETRQKKQLWLLQFFLSFTHFTLASVSGLLFFSYETPSPVPSIIFTVRTQRAMTVECGGDGWGRFATLDPLDETCLSFIDSESRRSTASR